MKKGLAKLLVNGILGLGILTGGGLTIHGVAKNDPYKIIGGLGTVVIGTAMGVVVGSLIKYDNNHYK